MHSQGDHDADMYDLKGHALYQQLVARHGDVHLPLRPQNDVAKGDRGAASSTMKLQEWDAVMRTRVQAMQKSAEGA